MHWEVSAEAGGDDEDVRHRARVLVDADKGPTWADKNGTCVRGMGELLSKQFKGK
jgi:hypothetical protein